MFTFSPLRRAGTALVASALTASVVVGGTTSANAVSSSSPAGHGATWLSHQLNKHGVIHNAPFDYDDYGLTIDTTFALKAIGGHHRAIAKSRRALSHHVGDYTTFKKHVYAGSLAKLLVFAQRTGGKARNFGGTNLVRRAAKRIAVDAPIVGRLHDKGKGDTANTIGQIFATRGLLAAANPKGDFALKFLLRQQCAKGFFRLSFNPDKTAARQGCSGKDVADNDATSLAVIELAKTAKRHPVLSAALRRATVWLIGQQARDGGVRGGPPTAQKNSNSTGLAGWAFEKRGRCGAAKKAAGWVKDLQVGGHLAGTPLAGERGAIAYDRAALRLAKHDGITSTTRDQWRRATAQAAPALLALSRCGT